MTAIPEAAALDSSPEPRIRNFVLFAAAQCAGATGIWAQKTAVGWLVWDLTHSPAWVGAIALSDLIAAIWVAPFAGAIADRSNPYRLIRLTQLFAMANTGVVWGLVVAGLASPLLLLAWAVIDATFQGFNQPVRMLVTGSLAPEGRLSQAIAANSIAFNLARTIGPAIAGLLMLYSGISSVFLLNACSFVAVFAVLLHVRRWIDRPASAPRSTRLIGDVRSGFAYIRNTGPIAMLFLLTLSFALLARPFTELFPAIAGGSFAGGPELLAMLMSAQGIGALIGASWMLKRRSLQVLARISYASALGIAASLVVFALAAGPLVALPAIAVAGLFHVACNIAMQSMAQLMSAPAMRGRVVALYTLIFRAAPALGAFVIGILAQWIDLQALIGLAAAAFALAVLVMVPKARRLYF
ncbi:MFS transporter [Shinella sp. S4-D37]|uniref:MFS transporter n=1 Tax=Shinella sp. S4-D37 TaxID=3161999 RepID=UPI003467AEA6